VNSSLSDACQRRLHHRLERELAERCSRNPRYSIRAFARWLQVDHSTIARLLRGVRPVTAATMARLEARLAASGLAELAPAEVRPVTADAILDLVGRPGFRPDSRRLARTLGVTVDAVNCCLFDLLRTNRLAMTGRRGWTVLPND
jgi:hypothetical protein